jgi:putative membrane protein
MQVKKENYFTHFGYSISKGGINMLRLIVRFIVSALVLMFVGFILPGFGPISFLNALIAAVVISVLGYLIEALFGKNVSPQGRGIIGFLTSAVVIYLAQYIVRDLDVTIIGALVAALIIGIIDIFVPTELR